MAIDGDEGKVFKILVELLLKDLINIFWVLNIYNLNVIEIEFRNSIPHVKRYPDPLTTVENLEFTVMNKDACLRTAKFFEHHRIRVDRINIKDHECRIRILMPKKLESRLRIAKMLRSLELKNIISRRLGSAYAYLSRDAKQCIELLEI